MKKVRPLIPDEAPITEAEAAKFLGVTERTMQVYAAQKKLEGTYIYNVIGKRMYFKSKLLYPHL